jgi:hypothetical protein
MRSYPPTRFVSAALLLILCCSASATRADGPSEKSPARDEFFTLVAMPDTQYYTEIQWKTDLYFKGQTQWIVDHRADEHIAFVFQLGDLQQDGNLLRTDDHQYDPLAKDAIAHAKPGEQLPNDFQWHRADEAMKILDDADVPYSAVAGNHDYFHWDRKTLPVNFLKYFGPQRYAGRAWFGGASPANATFPAGMNMYQTFSAGGVKFLSIGLQFAPDARDLAWAQKVIDANPG